MILREEMLWEEMAAVLLCSRALAHAASCCTRLRLTSSLRRPLVSLLSVPALLLSATTTRTSGLSRLLLVLSVPLSLRPLSAPPLPSVLSRTLCLPCFPSACFRRPLPASGASRCPSSPLTMLVVLAVLVLLVLLLLVLLLLVVPLGVPPVCCLASASFLFSAGMMAATMPVSSLGRLPLSLTMFGALCGPPCRAST